MTVLRPATIDDVNEIAEIWYAGWCDGHLGRVPDELLPARTPASFQTRAVPRIPNTTVATVDGRIAGFVTVIRDEVDQMYVAAEHRGTGIAQLLLRAGEDQVARNGFTEAWLAVVPGNARARAFYARAGWIDCGPFENRVEGVTGPVLVPAHRYTKEVS